MDAPMMVDMRLVAEDTHAITAYTPVPGFGVLPVNAFVIRSRQPVLIDTGLAALRQEFLAKLWSVVEPEDLRWIWITHTDPDHLGNLQAILEMAPNARVVTTYLGMGKMGLLGLPLDRVYLLNPGQSLDVGDRTLTAFVPPTFDAPETTGVYDTRSGALFSADCFGALLNQPFEAAVDIAPRVLREGVVTWATVDAPWLGMVEEDTFIKGLNTVRRLAPSIVLSAHLPPALDMTDTLLGHLVAARTAPAFVGPDQAAVEAMMAQAA